jgi:hypothetical protein
MASINLSIQEIEEIFYSALCNSLSLIGGYGLELDWKPAEYQAAKAKLQSASPNEALCFEDILMEILRSGGTLTLTDFEGGEDATTITLKDVHERMSKVPMQRIMDMINEEDDAETGDVIIQTIFLGEVVYG